MVPVRGIGTADVGSMRVDGCCGYKVGLCNNYVPLRNVLPVNVNDYDKHKSQRQKANVSAKL